MHISDYYLHLYQTNLVMNKDKDTKTTKTKTKSKLKCGKIGIDVLLNKK